MNIRTSLLLLLLSSSYSFTQQKILIDNKTSKFIYIYSTDDNERKGVEPFNARCLNSNEGSVLWVTETGPSMFNNNIRSRDNIKKCDTILRDKTKKVTVHKLLGRWFMTQHS